MVRGVEMVVGDGLLGVRYLLLGGRAGDGFVCWFVFFVFFFLTLFGVRLGKWIIYTAMNLQRERGDSKELTPC